MQPLALTLVTRAHLTSHARAPSRAHPFKVSRTHPPTLARTHPLTLSRTHPPTLSHAPSHTLNSPRALADIISARKVASLITPDNAYHMIPADIADNKITDNTTCASN